MSANADLNPVCKTRERVLTSVDTFQLRGTGFEEEEQALKRRGSLEVGSDSGRGKKKSAS